MSDLSPFGPSTQKYWDKRTSFFSKWDQGIQTDAEGLFSVKPEDAAREIARAMPGDIILDAFCGIGGSAIAFAREGKRVIAVDTNAKRLSMAKHNADIYGVTAKIDFLLGDVFKLYAPLFDTLKFASLHIDPPWGGPDYSQKTHFHFEDFVPNPKPLLVQALAAQISVGLALPLQFDLDELTTLASEPVLVDIKDLEKTSFKMAYWGAVAA